MTRSARTDPAAMAPPVAVPPAGASPRSAAGTSTPARPAQDPRAGVDPTKTSPAAKDRRHDVAAAGDPDRETGPVPAGRSLPGSVTDPAEPGTSSPQPRERQAAGIPGPETAAAPLLRGQAAVRARVQDPARGALDGARGIPAGSRGLRGQEFRDAMKRAQTGRKTTRAAASKRPAAPMPEPVADGADLTASAHCIRGCGWTAGPGDPAEVDKAADRHTTREPKHPTAVVAESAGAAA